MSHLAELQRWLRDSALAGMVIPSTDEFLSEFSPPANRRLLWATGFRGSTGIAVVLHDAAALFVDGRYRRQGAEDTQGQGIVVESHLIAARRAWLKRHLSGPVRLGIDPWLHSQVEMTQWQSLADELGFTLERVTTNPVDALWQQRPAEHRPAIVDYPIEVAGDSRRDKCMALAEHLRAQELRALLIADPEDVSWLLNVRAADGVSKTPVGEWHVVPSCTSRALLRSDGSVIWFVDADRLTFDVQGRDGTSIVITPPDRLEPTLRDELTRGRLGMDLRRTPAALAAIVEHPAQLCADDEIARRRWRKHPREVLAARRAHVTDAAAVIQFMAWLVRTVAERSVTEMDAAQALESFRCRNPAYKGSSAPMMSASGPNGAQPHYIPSAQTNRVVNDHPIFWMDSGGQYPGGTTDNTVTLAVGTPTPEHILAHTVVLQGAIALATERFPVGSYGLHLDTVARQPLWRQGMDFPHGTGHGVGNCLNVHEGPFLLREPSAFAITPIEAGMIMTNEPGYYRDGDFGLRLESHMVAVPAQQPGFLEFDTISRLPIDPRLVDFERLSSLERRWLAAHHRNVLQDVEPLLDAASAQWLRSVAEVFIRAADVQ